MLVLFCCLDVLSGMFSCSFWTSACLQLLRNPFLHAFSFLLDFLVPIHYFKVQSVMFFSLLLDFRMPIRYFKVHSTTLSHSFWTSMCLSTTSKSIPSCFLAPFGLSYTYTLLRSPIHLAFSLLLDFHVPLRYFKVHSASLLLHLGIK